MLFRRIRKIAEMLHLNRLVCRPNEKGDQKIPVLLLLRSADYCGTSTNYLSGRTNDLSKSRA